MSACWEAHGRHRAERAMIAMLTARDNTGRAHNGAANKNSGRGRNPSGPDRPSTPQTGCCICGLNCPSAATNSVGEPGQERPLADALVAVGAACEKNATKKKPNNDKTIATKCHNARATNKPDEEVGACQSRERANESNPSCRRGNESCTGVRETFRTSCRRRLRRRRRSVKTNKERMNEGGPQTDR
jgi:hypothetical protein